MTDPQEAATINFGKSISLEGTHELLRYVAFELPAHINLYNGYHLQMLFNGTTHVVTSRATVKITGTIRNLETQTFDAFESICNPQSSEELLGLRFQTIPGYELEEHRSETRELWNQVREKVKYYLHGPDK